MTQDPTPTTSPALHLNLRLAKPYLPYVQEGHVAEYAPERGDANASAPAHEAYGPAQDAYAHPGYFDAYAHAQYTPAYTPPVANPFVSPTYGASTTYTAPRRQVPAGQPSPWPPCTGTGLGYNRGGECAGES
jgi:hypothetical protein